MLDSPKTDERAKSAYGDQQNMNEKAMKKTWNTKSLIRNELFPYNYHQENLGKSLFWSTSQFFRGNVSHILSVKISSKWEKTEAHTCSIMLSYPFHWSKTLVAKHNDSDHWTSEANWEKKKIVTKVIGGCPGGATAGKSDYKVNFVGMIVWWVGGFGWVVGPLH